MALTANEIYQMICKLNADLFEEAEGEHTEIIIDAYICAIVSLLRGASGNDAGTLKLNGDFLVKQLQLKLDHQISEAHMDGSLATRH